MTNQTENSAPATRLPQNENEAFEIFNQLGAAYKGTRFEHEMIIKALGIIGLKLGILKESIPTASQESNKAE